MDEEMLSSHSSDGSSIRRGAKRKRGPGSHCTADSTGSIGRQARQCVQEGRWPNHPLSEASQTPPDLLTYHCTWDCVALANVRYVHWDYGLTSNPTRYTTHSPERKPKLLWIRSWPRRTCINTCRTSVKCYRILHSSICSTCCATACAPGSRMKVPRQSRQRPLPSRRSTGASIPVACQSCLQNFSNSMPNGHAEWLKGACGAYNLDRRYVMLSPLNPTHKLFTHTCGARNRAPGVGSFMKGTLRPYGCRCECSLENGNQQKHTQRHVPGRPSSTTASVFTCRTCVQLWLPHSAPMLPSNKVQACLMGRASPCPQQWKVKWLWENSVKPFAITLRRRQQQNVSSAWISCPSGRQTERRRTETSTTRGLPAVSRPLLCTPLPTHANPFRPTLQAPLPRIPPLNTPHRSKLAYRLRRDPPEPELRHPRADAAGLRASHRQCLRFMHGCCLLRVSWWATHSREGCRHLCRDLGRTYQVSSASYSAGYATGCSAVDTRWACCCLQAWKAVVVPPPTAHHTAQHLRAPQSPTPRFSRLREELISA